MLDDGSQCESRVGFLGSEAFRLTGQTYPVGLASTLVAALGTFVNLGFRTLSSPPLPQRQVTLRVRFGRWVVGDDGKLLRSNPEQNHQTIHTLVHKGQGHFDSSY